MQDKNNLGDQVLIVEDTNYNHLSTKLSVSIVQRNAALQNLAVLRETQKEFRKGSKVSSVLKELRMDENNKDSIFKSRDIQNKFARLRAETLGIFDVYLGFNAESNELGGLIRRL